MSLKTVSSPRDVFFRDRKNESMISAASLSLTSLQQKCKDPTFKVNNPGTCLSLGLIEAWVSDLFVVMLVSQ
jgi:hypothetical protein